MVALLVKTVTAKPANIGITLGVHRQRRELTAVNCPPAFTNSMDKLKENVHSRTWALYLKRIQACWWVFVSLFGEVCNLIFAMLLGIELREFSHAGPTTTQLQCVSTQELFR